MPLAPKICGELSVGVKCVTRFISFDGCSAPDQIRVPRFSQPDGLRELRCWQRLKPSSSPAAGTAQRDAMQSLDMSRPDNSEPRNTGIGAQGSELFIHRHERK